MPHVVRTWVFAEPSSASTPSAGAAGLRIVRVRHERWLPGESIRLRRRHNYVVIIVLGGRGHFESAAGGTDLTAGSVVTLVPDVAHVLTSGISDDFTFLRLIVEGVNPADIFIDHLGAASGAWRTADPDGVLACARQIEVEARSGAVGGGIIVAHLLAVCFLRLRREVDASRIVRGVAGRARDLIARTPHDPPGLATLASACGVSAEHLCRRFAAEFGEAPSHYARRLRQREAEDLLADGGLSVAAVANRLGFAEVSAFSKAFRRWTGRSPRQWRGQRDD